MILKQFSAIILSILFLLPLSLTAQESKDIATVKSILLRQQNDWNKGDIDAFMNGYWESDNLKFVGATGITYGYEATLKNYHKRYPDRAAMGQLTFGIKSVEKLSRKVIMLIGTWDLDRTSGPIGGYFTLMWQKIKGEWVVISDHTSARP
ncbi:MAG: DUF4440 domain-containing protein [Saprospiraceae bacterium]